jgi:hypothetical protein
MNKQKLLKPVNLMLMCTSLCLLVTVVLHDVIPPEVFDIIHPVFGFISMLLVICHVYLNWSWIKSNIITKETNT